MAKLVYFPLRGLGETIRLALADAGVAYKEEGAGVWPETKAAGVADGSLPFGQLPRYEDEDGSFVQSKAILRHLARKHGLYGASEAQRTHVDMVMDEAADIRSKYVRMIYVDELSEGSLAAHKAWLLNKPFGVVGLLEAWKGRVGGDWMAGDAFSIADLELFDVCDAHLRVIPELFAEAPALKAWFERVAARPNIAAYLASKPAHRERVNGNNRG